MIISVTKTVPSVCYYTDIDTDELNLTEEQLEDLKNNPDLVMSYVEDDELDLEMDQFAEYMEDEYYAEIDE